MDPTALTVEDHQLAFDHLNAALFENCVPPCVLTLVKGKRFRGYYIHRTFQRVQGGERVDEIALNPQAYTDLRTYLSTLAHEMVHALQQHTGTPGKNGHHNKAWAALMLEIGLTPVSLDRPGGMTGKRVTHAIVDGGPFDVAYRTLTRGGFSLRVRHAEPPEEQAGRERRRAQQRASKTRFSCPNCGQHAWAKRTSLLMCAPCRVPLAIEEPER